MNAAEYIAINKRLNVLEKQIVTIVAAVRERDNTIARVRAILDSREYANFIPRIRAALDPQETP